MGSLRRRGIAQGLAYHTKGQGSRYVSSPKETIDGLWALDVTGYELDEVEAATTVTTFTPKLPPEDGI